MNTFKAKKIGEVLAFEKTSQDTLQAAQEGFVKAFGQEWIDDINNRNQRNIDLISSLDVSEEFREIIESKAEATKEKLKKMRDMYIGDEWDDPAEVLEWSGFFEGSAIVHWNLVDGLAEEGEYQDLRTVASEALKLHSDFFDQASNQLRSIGIDKSKA